MISSYKLITSVLYEDDFIDPMFSSTYD